MGRHRIEGFLLDIDGTFLDSNDAHAKAWQDAFREEGFDPDYLAIRDSIGMGSDHLLPHLINVKKESAIGKRLDERCGEIFRERYLSGLKPFPGAQQFVETLLKHGFKTVVATSASEDDINGLLGRAGLKMLKKTTTSDDADRSKPSPDIIVAALQKGGLTGPHAIMIGDTPYDIEAAKRAGVKAIAFTCGGWPEARLTGAAAVYKGPAELLQAWAAADYHHDFWNL